MSHPQLDNLVRIGKLKAEPAARSELVGLIRSGSRRLHDAAREDLGLESRFDLAYNAAHALALAALRFRGYRSGSRYLVFQCLQHTLNLPAEQWRVLDQAHRKRNLAEYEGEMDVDEQLVAALLRVAREVARRVNDLVALDSESWTCEGDGSVRAPSRGRYYPSIHPPGLAKRER